MVDFRMSVTAAEERRLREFISALRTRCEAHMNPTSAWNSEEFESEFRVQTRPLITVSWVRRSSKRASILPSSRPVCTLGTK